jgi:hypothetical protein
MNKKSLIVIVLLFIFGVAALVSLQSYKLELIHTIVVHAVIQKAPPAFPEDRIQATFQAALLHSRQTGQEDDHFQSLLKLSQRLEKIQSLSSEEVESLLQDFSHNL